MTKHRSRQRPTPPIADAAGRPSPPPARRGGRGPRWRCSARRRSCARRRRRRSASASGRSRPGLPFFAAIEKGYFKEAGLDVEPLKFAGAQQVMEAMLVRPLRRQRQRHRLGQPRDRRDRAARPVQDLLHQSRATRSTCSTSSSSPRTARSRRSPTSRASGVASGPGIQNVTLCKTMLERAGATGTTVIELPIGQHVAAHRRRPGRRRATRSSRPARSAA